ncbi:alpha/beta hydrolase [Algoriphagus halophytocola]|uniref:Alpha/beta hydrolase n=1 Tax=Algoriphagus halophytocola TaxID=2991499 RepID=A0ABY6MDK4_9BACT|nr:MULTISPECIES: alpha/beta hydrolase [unclassified Algoriphagus]UZD21845.1 alpha/beta hydrolase [Algoriphagus sp. TR-M5]WBL43059.1 alpha/beta hydrolase [Algoriphagus sp. TR-M9]
MLYYKKYELGQEKDWVVFVHGAGGSSAVWFKQLRDFKEQYNLLLIDLRGHGKSSDFPISMTNKDYTFEAVTRDIIEVLDYESIGSAHFAGVSLGTIIVRQLAELQPDRVRSLIMAGAVTRLTTQSRVLVFLGNTFKRVIPYMWLYSLFAFVIMPRKHHSESRNLFIREAKKLCQKEFIRWFKLTKDINPLLRYFKESDLGIPTLYVMGDQDVMFLEPVKRIIEVHKNSVLTILKKCGHVVNVEQPLEFNRHSLAFLQSQSL